MPRPRQDRYIINLLSDDEIEMIDFCRAVDRVWFGSWAEATEDTATMAWQKHWSLRGEDGHREINYEVFGKKMTRIQRYIDMRQYTWTSSVTGAETPIGYIECERIVPWKPGVVPTTINKFIERWFGKRQFGFQLYIYYMLQQRALIVGGRGSAKSEGIARAAATWISLHPGEPWGHYALFAQQANIVYDAILADGARRQVLPGAITEAPLSWVDVFVESAPKAPHPMIKLKPWDDADEGNFVICQPLGASRDASSTRGADVRRMSVDEATRDLPERQPIDIAAGGCRGINEYVVRRLPVERQAEIRNALLASAELEELRARGEADADQVANYNLINRRLRQIGVTCHLGVLVVGNRGPHQWVDQWLAEAQESPPTHYGEVVSFLVNPYLDQRARQALISTFSTPAEARVELYALKPLGLGSVFTTAQLLRAESPALSALMAENKEKPDWQINRWGSYTTLWQRPREPSGHYVLGADPGTGAVPERDSWNVQVYRVIHDDATHRAELVYWQWGNTNRRDNGSYLPFLAAVYEAINLYKIASTDAIIQMSGPETGIAEIAFGEKGASRVTIVPMTASNKMAMANYVRQLLGKQILTWPSDCSDLTTQLSNWAYADRDLPQDLVMSLFGASWRLFAYFYEYIVPPADRTDESVVAEAPENIRARRLHPLRESAGSNFW